MKQRARLQWVVIGTIVPIVIGLLLAVLMWSRPRGFTIVRTVYVMGIRVMLGRKAEDAT